MYIRVLNEQNIYYVWNGQSYYLVVTEKISALVVNKYNKIFEQLGCKDIIVETNKSKFCKLKYYWGHAVEVVWTLDIFEEKP